MSTSPTIEHPSSPDRRIALIVTLALILVGAIAATIYALDDDPSPPLSAIEGSGVAASESRTVASFDGIELSGSNNVVIRTGEAQSVLVSGDDNLLGRVTTEVRADTLVIDTTPGSFTTQVPMRVEVVVPSLDALTLSGSGTITISGVDRPSVTVTISGSGVVQASGAANELDVTVSGSGQAKLADLVSTTVRAVVSGSGMIAVTATESLDASVPGSGEITYRGDPKSVTKSITGSGAINPA